MSESKCVVCVNDHYLLRSSGELERNWGVKNHLPQFIWVLDHEDAKSPDTQKKIRQDLLKRYSVQAGVLPQFKSEYDIRLTLLKVEAVKYFQINEIDYEKKVNKY